MNLHPFTFVPFGPEPGRKPLQWTKTPGHDRFDPNLSSGVFHCTLTTLTPLCVKAHFSELRRAGKAPWIPGSTLKGLVRNAVEMLGAGCTNHYLYREKDQRGREKMAHPHRMPFQPCERAACLACRVFGFAPKKKGKEDKEEFVWSAKVAFSDTESAPIADWEPIPGGTARLESHNARHTAFYSPGGPPAGWKIYRHARRTTGANWRYAEGVWCVPAGTVFPFDVEFLNLDAEEMAVFQFGLTLEHACEQHTEPVRLCHKLGYGKGLGLGSCRIHVASVEWANPKRYFGEPPQEPVTAPADCPLTSYLEAAAFRDVMAPCLDFERAADEVEYPGRGWFDDYPRDSIAQFEEWVRERDEPLPPRPVEKTEPPPPPPPPEPEPALRPGRRVVVEITAAAGKYCVCTALIAGETWTGRLDRTGILRPGMRFRARVDTVDAYQRTFRASQPKVVER
jgi:hypothetical protein